MLQNAKPGEVYNFEYLQPMSGASRRYLAKVLSIRKFTDDDISDLYARSDYRKWDGDFGRTHTLVTCMTPDGQVRNFYAERTDSCKKSLLGKLLFLTGIARFVYR